MGSGLSDPARPLTPYIILIRGNGVSATGQHETALAQPLLEFYTAPSRSLSRTFSTRLFPMLPQNIESTDPPWSDSDRCGSNFHCSGPPYEGEATPIVCLGLGALVFLLCLSVCLLLCFFPLFAHVSFPRCHETSKLRTRTGL